MIKTVKARLLTVFAGVIVAMTAIVAVALMAMNASSERVKSLSADTMNEVALLGTLESVALQRAVVVRDLALTEDVDVQTELFGTSKALADRTQTLLADLSGDASAAGTDEMIESIVTRTKAVEGLLSEVRVAIDEGRYYDVAPMIADRVRPEQSKLLTQIRGAVEARVAEAERVAQDIASESAAVTTSLIVGLAIMAILSLSAALWVSSRIVGALGVEPGAASLIMRDIAKGNLSEQRAPAGARAKSLILAVQEMQDGLVHVVDGVRTAATNVALAADEIASGNVSLSQRVEEEASTVEQSVEALERLVERVQSSATDAERANELAAQAKAVVVKGGQVVNEVVATMREINESSQRVREIITVIDGIAFQTNILALNAAVEAARAGEQGRGFAVVAAEVRSLAQRSAKAASEITDLISSTVEKIDHGSQLVDKAGTAMSEVVDVTGNVTSLMTNINEAGSEQLVTLSEINTAFRNMDSMVQQNAALVEESATASMSLKDQADTLVESVSVFRTGSTS